MHVHEGSTGHHTGFAVFVSKNKQLTGFPSAIRMAPALGAAEAEWLAQLASMRKAIQDLKLDQQNYDPSVFEAENSLTDEDLGGGNSDDIWDISDEEDDEYSSDSLEIPEENLLNGTKPISFGKDWLRAKCANFAARRSGLDASELEQQITALLASDSQGAYLVDL